MKILSASLMCLVLGTANCLALKGGPVYPGSTASIVGTFAGVMQSSTSAEPCGANSLGVFSVGVPRSGIASGTFVMFSQGRVFTGTVRGTADPGRSTLKAVLSATFDFTATFINPVTGALTSTDVTASANGTLDTSITGAAASAGTASTRLQGDANLDISHGELNPDLTPVVVCPIELTVFGFKQSNTAPLGNG